MANATAPSAHRSDPASLPAEAPAGITARFLPARARPLLLILWTVIVALFAAFLAFGTLRMAAGHWGGRRLGVREVWPRFAGYLMDQGATPLAIAGVTIAAVLTLALAAVYLWLAFTLEDAPADAVSQDLTET